MLSKKEIEGNAKFLFRIATIMEAIQKDLFLSVYVTVMGTVNNINVKVGPVNNEFRLMDIPTELFEFKSVEFLVKRGKKIVKARLMEHSDTCMAFSEEYSERWEEKEIPSKAREFLYDGNPPMI